MYGTFAGPKPEILLRSRRKTLNVVPITVALFFPWLMFSVLYALLSFYWHYKYPHLTYAAIAVALTIIVMNGAFALELIKKQVDDDFSLRPTWFLFTFVTALLAWILAIVLGDMNFYYHMQPFYDVVNLNMYDGVDPSRTKGVELMDAGRIIFTGRSQLDLQKAVGFRNFETYCAAPITVNQGNASLKPLLSYDFWAVGVGCCSGAPGDFRCGDYNNHRAHAGLRLLRDDQRPFFRLAVQQAEAAYGIKATHPVFFHWLADPSAEAINYQENGFKYYVLGMFGHFGLQLMLVAGAINIFTRMGKA